MRARILIGVLCVIIGSVLVYLGLHSNAGARPSVTTLPGYHIVLVVKPNAKPATAAVASCNPGEEVVGGGGKTKPNRALTSDRPDGPSEWYIAYIGTGPVTVYVYAICVKAST